MKDMLLIIKNNGIAVTKTDTIYGIITSAYQPQSVEKLYKIKHRNTKKPFIILIEKISDLEQFGINLPKKRRSLIEQYWPGPTSIIFELSKDRLHDLLYLHRGVGALAFRIPQSERMLGILKKTGPLIAPSANPEGKPVARDIFEAKKYFGDMVDYYSDDGFCENTKASSLIKVLENGNIKIIRE